MGGGKSAPAAQIAEPINTTTSVGDLLDPVQETFDESEALSEKKETAIETKKKGTRGLQIPKEAKTPTAANQGVQL